MTVTSKGIRIGVRFQTPTHMNALLLSKPKTVGKYDQMQCKIPINHTPHNFFSGYASVKNIRLRKTSRSTKDYNYFELGQLYCSCSCVTVSI